MREFEKRAIVKSFMPDIVSAFLIFAYAFFSVRIPIDIFFSNLKILIGVILVEQFVFALITDHLCYRNIAIRLDKFKNFPTTEKERTKLFEDLMQYPFYCAFMTFAYFTAGGVFIIFYLASNYIVAPNILASLGIEFFFGIYFACLTGYNANYSVCSDFACDIVSKGVERDYIMRKQIFGLKVSTQLLIYIAIPAFFSCIISCTILIEGYYPFDKVGYGEPGQLQITRMFYTCALNLIATFASAMFFHRNSYVQNKRMSDALKLMAKSDYRNLELIETDITDEFSYNQFLANQMFIRFREILENTSKFGQSISRMAAELASISNETEATSVEQSTGTKEIVSTMENATNLSHDIENRISIVTTLAKETVENVNKGSDLLEQSLDYMNSIADTNEITIQGIKDLTNKISSIWEIANIIDSISDQTKIIAFNAELESTSANASGKNFKNVSNEIRRLANSTMDSTREIKMRMNEIQRASEVLIKSSEDNTQLIRHGTEFASGLEDKFTNIRNSATSNSNSANEIQYLVEQQTLAFDQIVKTLQQISMSIQDFSMSTRTLIETSKTLQANVHELSSMNLCIAKI